MPEETWLKGQLHLHTENSGDSATPVAAALRWYEAHGFDFVVVTDHNFVSAPARAGRMLVAPGVELTQNVERCEPPPEPGLRCLLHVNALFVAAERTGRFQFPPASSPRRDELFTRALQASEELGGVAMLNHPNFHYAADAGLLTALSGSGLRLFELANEAVDSNNAGDAAHPSTEALWDAALTSGARLFAVATDDAHHYDDAPAVTARGETAYTGDRGFVVVHATRDLPAIRAALLAGEFYASTGLLLNSVTRADGALTVEAAQAGVTIEFVGAGGEVLRTVTGPRATMTLAEAPGPYVRARVRAADGRRAWTQPIWRE
ncbi:CehA/McbA family metallohydrolase [Nannocystis sp. ILAH1]|uniref:CehA/McbA family metallohydrolase n=1 Tax=unclassified Nannocystis TaxID=2627009 RepID=UPI0022717908|nr:MULTISPECIES: CehA/McbA family metallohydrolase [unclassified Nannocystis]MCY0986762.1 CehA/McbA family metallohydrolase [Nannocystis sp. ILAH1]MCY1071641.1 CehA/McbA family metallohydrolase [Nannocystis sp. RBIL2]